MDCHGSPLIFVVSVVSARKWWKECLQHPPDSMAKVCGEVVEDEFWPYVTVKRGYGTNIWEK